MLLSIEAMAREIKFRIWNGAEMVRDVTVGKFGVFYVNPSNDGLDLKDSASITPFTTKYHSDTPVMQYTGLVDVNGEEIFEGDVLKHNNGYLIEVQWGHHLWAFIPINRKPLYRYQDACFPSQFKVIGNIYEHPELLNE
jgi:hypothetical protein